MEITDVKAALGKVRSFIALLETNRRMFSDPPTPSELDQIEDLINEALPLVRRIAARADSELADDLKIDGFPKLALPHDPADIPAACGPAGFPRGSRTNSGASRTEAGRSEPASLDLERGGRPLE